MQQKKDMQLKCSHLNIEYVHSHRDIKHCVNGNVLLRCQDCPYSDALLLVQKRLNLRLQLSWKRLSSPSGTMKTLCWISWIFMDTAEIYYY